MLTVRQVVFRGVREQGGQRLAEVEVSTDHPKDSKLLAYFRSGPKGYQLVRVLSDKAGLETDWFDNRMHDAYDDVTMTMFAGPSHGGENDRSHFARQVLEYDGIVGDFDRNMRQP
ncbi:hypothetical protein ACFPVX_04590 [Cohnella faecalis]|uniref:Uncharacterized protein n=1 Tax=Cohnella faecalis TaxID=2315694 RepID=A0A398CT20_9BACL|nr:hypothetical protein [Cohnella faecalis]RIE03908.1 hypothetical protein D3H35_08045 [Cohnella faecalis]